MALAASILTAAAAPASAREIDFTLGELLGKPTNSSITVNFQPAETVEVYVEYGTAPGTYTGTTATITAPASAPSEITITGLSANTRYYYRLRYATTDQPTLFESRPEHSFWTQRAPGSPFTFVVQADSHIVGGPDTSAAVYDDTIANMAADNPDFVIDVGDIFEVRTSANVTNSFYAQQRTFLEPLTADAAVFLTVGNHENEEGWWRTGSGNNGNPQTPIWSINGRKRYFANPVPNGFYTGDTQTYTALGVTGDGRREAWYSWTWGDALFVVLDPFWNTTTRPHANGAGADPGTDQGDNWSWTLGQTQYNWLHDTLTNSNARYKFVVTHQLVGGSPDGYGRGGASAVAAGYEWGATGAATPAHDFADNRPGWNHGSIHDILVDNDVSVVFHGHDHCYADEVRDGIVYQEVAMPNDAGTSPTFCGGYSNVIPNSGHTRVSVTPSLTTVNYVRSTGTIADTYTLAPSNGGPTPPIAPTADAGPNQTVTATEGNDTETVTLDGSDSSDPDGNITSYVWSEGATQIATGSNPDVELAVGTHVITLEVTDDDDLTDTDTVTITVDPAPIAPTADAGPDQTVTDTDGNGNESVTLDGSASTDPDGTITAYRWTEGGPPIATGVNPIVSLGVGTHVITLRVTDNDNLMATDTVTVTVNAPPPPTTAPPPTTTTTPNPPGDSILPTGGQLTVQARYDNRIAVSGLGAATSDVTVAFVDPSGGPTCDDFVTRTGGRTGCDLHPGWTATATGTSGSTATIIRDLEIVEFDTANETVTVKVRDDAGLTYGCGGSVGFAYGADIDSGADAVRMVTGPGTTVIDLSRPGSCAGTFDDTTADVTDGRSAYLSAWDADGDRTVEVRAVQDNFDCPTGGTPFVDMPSSSFATADIACIYGLGLTIGTSDTTYSPHDLVTREQMAAFLARVARLLGVVDPGTADPFVDVPAHSFARFDIALIHALGVTEGTSPTTFSPYEYVTREQMAAFLARLHAVLLGSPTEPVRAVVASTPFGDVPATSFAADDVGRIYGLDITTGTSATTYSPDAPVTREQMAAFLARLVRLLNFV